MELWTRGAPLAAAVLLWVAVRIASRKPVMHPWFAAMLTAACSMVLTQAAESSGPGGHRAYYGLACFTGFLTLLAFSEGLRRESGAAASRGRRIAIAVAASALVACGCALLPAPHDRLVADTLGASLLLCSLPALLWSKRRRAGSLTLAAGIGIYAFGRSILAYLALRGSDPIAAAPPFDAAAIAVLGLGLAVFAAETARERFVVKKARRAVGGDPTLA